MANLFNQTEDAFRPFDITTGQRKSIDDPSVIEMPPTMIGTGATVGPDVYFPEDLNNTIKKTMENAQLGTELFPMKLPPSNVDTFVNKNIEQIGTLQPDSQRIWNQPELIPKVFRTVLALEHLIRKDLGKGDFKFDSNFNELEYGTAVSGFIANALSGKGIKAYANEKEKIDPRKIWWCASYIHHILEQSGLPTVSRKKIASRDRQTLSGRAAPARADQYKYHGEAVEGGLKNARSGDLIILDYEGDGRGDHVAFYVGDEISFDSKTTPRKGFISILGGNQDGKEVSIIQIPISDVLTVRRITPETIQTTTELFLENNPGMVSPMALLTKEQSPTDLQNLQKQINEALKQSGGQFTKEINELVKQRTKLKQNLNKGGTPMNRNNYRVELVSDLEDAPKFNKGGLYQEGGMQDDGMNRDPVSGNEIPPGSLAKEVRDDIPAQLSEGEYVVPADVVQYYGLKFFEDLRDKAKMALARMERDGRIGGEPVNTEPQMDTGDFPFSVDELQTFSEGGTPRGYQPGGGVTFVSTPATTMQPNPLTYVSPVMATPQMNQTSNFGTGVSGGVYTSGVTVPTGMTMPSVSSSIKTERYINDQCSELTLLEGQGAPAGYVLASSPKGIEYSKACFPERYPDDQQDTSAEDDTQTTAEPDGTQVTQAQQDDNENKRQGNDVSYANASSDVFFEDPKTKENFVAKVGGRDGYAGDQSGPAKNWTYDDYSAYLKQLESGVDNIYGSIPIVSDLVKKRHKEVLKSAKERLTSGLNSNGKTLSVNERIVLENVLLHEEIGGIFSLFNKSKDEEIGNINDLLELDKEMQTADGVTYTIKYVGIGKEYNGVKADRYGYVRIIDGKAVDSSKLTSVLADASFRSVYQDGAKYDSNALRDFLATGVSTVTDLAGNQHLARIRGDYYSVGGILTPIKDIMEEIRDPELAMKLANNPSLLLGYLPPALRSDGKVPEEQEPGYQKPDFGIKPGIDQGGFIRPDPTDPFAGSFTPDLFDPAYDAIEKDNIPPTSIETSDVGPGFTTGDTSPQVAGDVTSISPTLASSVNQTNDLFESVGEGITTTGSGADVTSDDYETASGVATATYGSDKPKADESSGAFKDDEPGYEKDDEPGYEKASGASTATYGSSKSSDDDDDDKYGGTKITTPGSYGGYSGVPGGRATGGAIMKRNKKQTIQMEKVKI